MRSKILLTLAALGMAACGKSESPAPTYAISGTVSGAVATGVTITLSGTSSATTTTASGGTYSFAGLANGTYAVTPSLAGYVFTPASVAVTVADANVTGKDFTSAVRTYDVSGVVSGTVVQGVTITLGSTPARTATTDVAGAFVFTGVANGSYTVVPSLTGYVFSPTSRVAVVNAANVTGMNFTASVPPGPTYAISGAVSGAIQAVRWRMAATR
jgi:hypothetical protein